LKAIGRDGGVIRAADHRHRDIWNESEARRVESPNGASADYENLRRHCLDERWKKVYDVLGKVDVELIDTRPACLGTV
jgi:hypothetical protein